VIDQEPLPTGTQHDKRPQFRTQSVGHGESRARVDTVAERLQRLGVILEQHDADALREWRLSSWHSWGLELSDEQRMAGWRHRRASKQE
jgi:hypothetical protein